MHHYVCMYHMSSVCICVCVDALVCYGVTYIPNGTVYERQSVSTDQAHTKLIK